MTQVIFNDTTYNFPEDYVGYGFLTMVTTGTGVVATRWLALMIDFLADAIRQLGTTSSTSNTIGAGTKTFVLDEVIPLVPGGNIRFIHDEGNWMDGIVLTWTESTKTAIIEVPDASSTAGSGTYTSWQTVASGAKGVQGIKGDKGDTGWDVSSTSVSTNTIGTGSKTFVLATDVPITEGINYRAIDASDPTIWMDGIVTSYTSATKTVIINMESFAGSGTLSSWVTEISGAKGAKGDTGAVGNTYTWTPETANFNAVDTNNYLCDTTAGAFTGTLPASPGANANIRFADVFTSWGNELFTIGRNGQTINGLTEDFICDTPNTIVTMNWDNVATTWRPLNG